MQSKVTVTFPLSVCCALIIGSGRIALADDFRDKVEHLLDGSAAVANSLGGARYPAAQMSEPTSLTREESGPVSAGEKSNSTDKSQSDSVQTKTKTIDSKPEPMAGLIKRFLPSAVEVDHDEGFASFDDYFNLSKDPDHPQKHSKQLVIRDNPADSHHTNTLLWHPADNGHGERAFLVRVDNTPLKSDPKKFKGETTIYEVSIQTGELISAVMANGSWNRLSVTDPKVIEAANKVRAPFEEKFPALIATSAKNDPPKSPGQK